MSLFIYISVQQWFGVIYEPAVFRFYYIIEPNIQLHLGTIFITYKKIYDYDHLSIYQFVNELKIDGMPRGLLLILKSEGHKALTEVKLANLCRKHWPPIVEKFVLINNWADEKYGSGD